MKVVICGAAGQLGSELVIRFKEEGHEVLAYDLDLDITDFDLIMSKVPELKPDLLINSAAHVNADEAELKPEISYRVNFTGTQNLALAAQKVGCPLVFISSDYVFDGEKGTPYTEFDEPNPLGVYGKAKLAAERYIVSVLNQYYIFRTQWIFGKYSKRDFVKSILKNAKEKGELRVVTDETGSPTSACDLAQIIYLVSTSGKFGTYHATNSGVCSRFEFAKEILDIAGWSEILVQPILYKELNLPCPRPKYSPLENMNLRLQGFPSPRPYGEPLKEYISWLLREGIV